MKVRPIMMVRRLLHDDAGQLHECFVPIDRFTNLFIRQYPRRDGEDHEYPMVPHEPRNMGWHRAYFAELKVMFDNLPDHIKKHFPTEAHLRSWALVHTHWCQSNHIACKDQESMMRLATYAREENGLAVIKLDEEKNTVHIFTPRSQSVALMSKEDFEASSRDVLDLVQSLNPDFRMPDVKKEAAQLTKPVLRIAHQ